MVCTLCEKDGHNSRTCPKVASTTKEIVINLEEEIIEKLFFLIDTVKEVANILKKGRTEGVYQKAICHELQRYNISYTEEETMPILYKDKYVGQERLDIVLTSFLDIILELKAISCDLKSDHYWQALSYMKYKKCNYGMVVNFNQSPAKNLSYEFIIIKEGTPYLFDLLNNKGTELIDYQF